MTPRPASVHQSALSPSEYDAYSAWMDELDSQISRLGRGLRFGEMLAFIRNRTPVDREAEIMSFFGSIPQQQSLGIGEFFAILRLLAHARTCATLTRDHIFIQTHPVVFTSPSLSPPSRNPFLSNSAASISAYTDRLDVPGQLNLREAAAKKSRMPPPSLASGDSPTTIVSPVTPKASSNPFRMQPTPQSASPHLQKNVQQDFRPPTPPESIATTGKSPALPPRPSSLSKQPPPKHVTQLFRKLDDGTQTPTLIKPLHVPALGPTSLDIVQTSIQPEHTEGSSTSCSTGREQKPALITLTNKKSQDNVRLLGSSHIGVDARPLRSGLVFASDHRAGSSFEACMSQDNASKTSLTSLDQGLPKLKQQASSANSNSGETSSKAKAPPPVPPLPRRRPESVYVARDPATNAQKLVFTSGSISGHSAPYEAVSIRSSPPKQRDNSIPYVMHHHRAASLAGSSHSHPLSSYRRPSVPSAGLSRATSLSQKSKALDGILATGRDVSQDWLQKARAKGMHAAKSEDRQGLIAADDVTFTANSKLLIDDDDDSDSDSELAQREIRHGKRAELDRMRTEGEPGWSRLE